MKRKIRLVSLLLIISLLGGCQNKEPISAYFESSPQESSSIQQSSKEESSSVFSSKEESSLIPSSIEEKDWDEEIKKEMLDYFSYVLPYFDLGTISQHSFSFDPSSYVSLYPTYTLIGDADLDALKSEIQKAFIDDGFVLMDSDYEVSYQKDEVHLTINFDYDETTDGTVVEVVYSEPFDSSTASSYAQSDYDLMKQELHGHILPYVYLGTKFPFFKWVSDYSRLSVYGGKFSSTVYDLAKTAFENTGYQVSEVYDNTEERFTTGSKKILAEKTFDDGCTFSIKVGKTYIGYEKCFLSATFKEAFEPSFQTQWLDQIKNELDQNLDSHAEDIPYLYLGTTNPRGSYQDNSFTYTLTGAAFDSRVLTLASDTLTEASWEDILLEEEVLTASKTFTDGCQVKLKLFQNSDGKAALSFVFYEKYDFSSLSSWSQEQQNDFATFFGENEAPFLYLGTKNPKGSYQDNYQLIDTDGYQLLGGRWNETVLSDGETSLVSQGYTVSHVKKGCGDYALEASKSFTDGSTFIVYLFKNYDDRIEMRLFQDETYDPDSVTSWSEDMLDCFDSYLDGHQLPFIYLGKKEPDEYYASYHGSEVLTGGTYDERMLSSSKETLENDSWETETVTISKKGNYVVGSTVLKASKEYDDGHILSLTLGECASGFYHDRALLVITMREKYDPSSFTIWDQDILDSVNSIDFDYHPLPNLYLNDPSPYGDINHNGKLEITGGWYDQQVLSDAEEKLTSLGWTCTMYTEYRSTFLADSKALSAVKVMDDGCYATILLGEDKWDYKVHLFYSVEETFDFGKVNGSYDTNTQSNLDVLANHCQIPYLYLNTDTLTQSRGNKNGFLGGDFHSAILSNAQRVLLKEDWTVLYCPSDTSLSARKEFANGITVLLTISNDNGQAYLSISSYDTPTIDSTHTSYDESIVKGLDTYLHHHEIPFFDLGEHVHFTNLDIDLDTNEFGYCGEMYSQAYYENAKDVFIKQGWSVSETNSYYGTLLLVTRTYDDGCTISGSIGLSSKDRLAVNFTLYKC